MEDEGCGHGSSSSGDASTGAHGAVPKAQHNQRRADAVSVCKADASSEQQQRLPVRRSWHSPQAHTSGLTIGHASGNAPFTALGTLSEQEWCTVSRRGIERLSARARRKILHQSKLFHPQKPFARRGYQRAVSD